MGARLAVWSFLEIIWRPGIIRRHVFFAGFVLLAQLPPLPVSSLLGLADVPECARPTQAAWVQTRRDLPVLGSAYAADSSQSVPGAAVVCA